MRRIRARATLTMLAIVLVFGAIVFVLWLGAHAVLEGTMTGGDLGQFILYAGIVADSIPEMEWQETEKKARAVLRAAEQYFGELGETVRTVRNDEITLEQIAAMKPDRICISPGPKAPKDAGISLDILREFKGKLPILGVCLGHQAIGEAFGGK
ncbi:hypothetical protein LTR94_031357, partial [Friedmanniomyces endolithicus]